MVCLAASQSCWQGLHKKMMLLLLLLLVTPCPLSWSLDPWTWTPEFAADEIVEDLGAAGDAEGSAGGNYNYGYKVRKPEGGLDYSHQEGKEQGVVRGSYRCSGLLLLLPQWLLLLAAPP